MSNINDIKEQMGVVASVGDFTNAMQQIATIRMMRLRTKVADSRLFVETAHEMLTELTTLRDSLSLEQQMKLERKHAAKDMTGSTKRAVILITSNQGLIGRYNNEIYAKFDKVRAENKDADIFVIGKKGQEYFAAGAVKNVSYYPYEVPDTFTAETLQRLVSLFDFYNLVTLIYSHYVNSATREVVALSVTAPTAVAEGDAKKEARYIFEPDIIDLINGVSKTLRAALFQQQIMDGRLAQYSAQMLGMKAATDNAVGLTADLRMEYNKLRRKMIDKKISEVFAGSALW